MIKNRFHRIQRISLRLYNYPQKTDKESFYKYQDIMYQYIAKLITTKGNVIHKMYTGYDDIHGEYTEIRASRLTNKGCKDKIIWINARG
jgi:hypothetical protein